MALELSWPWVALLLLGATHGVNPGMGWLFAVALGLQERSSVAVWRSLAPLAIGHALAMVAALAAAIALGAVIPLGRVRWVVAATLLVVGVRTLRGHRHSGWGGMRVGVRDLTVWSFLMATAHGAGLMALPFVLAAAGPSRPMGAQHHHGAHASIVATTASALPEAGLLAALVHAAGYLLATGVIAVVVYERLGLGMLRRAWVNLDLIWGVALIATAALTLAI